MELRGVLSEMYFQAGNPEGTVSCTLLNGQVPLSGRQGLGMVFSNPNCATAKHRGLRTIRPASLIDKKRAYLTPFPPLAPKGRNNEAQVDGLD